MSDEDNVQRSGIDMCNDVVSWPSSALGSKWWMCWTNEVVGEEEEVICTHAYKG